MRGGQGLGGLLQFIRPHVAGRRVDEVARQEHAVGDAAHMRPVCARWQREAQCLAGLLAVAGEDIAAQNERKRRKIRRRQVLGKMPFALGQRPRQGADGKLALAVADAEQRAGESATVARQDQRAACLAGKAIGSRPGDDGRRKARAVEAVLSQQINWQGGFRFLVNEFDRHSMVSEQAPRVSFLTVR